VLVNAIISVHVIASNGKLLRQRSARTGGV